MELKVWVEGIQRIVCGVTDVTTCQDVVYALAHATGKTGRFTLMERWRNSEHLLAPHEHPLKILLKWGEYASDVQFILQRTAFEPKSSSEGRSIEAKTIQQPGQRSPAQTAAPLMTQGGGGGPQQQQQQQQQRLMSQKAGGATPQSPLQSRDIKKSLTFSGGHSSHSPHTTSSEGLLIGPEVGVHPSPTPMIPQGYIPRMSHPTMHPMQTPQQQQQQQIEATSSGVFPPSHPRLHYPPPHTSSGRAPPPPNFSINRPLAPPPYELVRGHPPPPPSGGTTATRHFPPHSISHPTSAFGSYHANKDWRNPPLYRARPPPPPPREQLPPPPYRDPPPPPPPSHPALVKISPPKGTTQPPNASPMPSPSLNSEGGPHPPLALLGQERNFQAENTSNTVSNDSHERDRELQGGAGASTGTPPKGRDRSSPAIGGSNSSKDEPFGKFNSQKQNRVSDKIRKETRNANFKEEKNNSESPVPSVIENSNKAGRGTESPSRSPNKNTPSNTTLDENHHHQQQQHFVQNNSSSTDVNVADSPSQKKNTKVNKSEAKERFVNSGEIADEKSMVQSIIKQLVKNSTKEINSSSGVNNNNHHHPSTEEVVVDNYYRELVKLVNQQREKISAQQIDLTKYEAEIAFTEGRWKEEESRLAYLRDEIQRLEKVPDKQGELKQLSQLEEQLKAAKVTEASAEEDVVTIQKKISSCNEKLSQMNERVRSIEEALRKEEELQHQKIQETLQEEEQEAMLREIEKLNLAVEQATKQADHTQEISKQLAQELQEAESRLEDKRAEIESLKQAMRDANLEALSMTPPEEAKTLSESRAGSTKAGTNRRMVGSPRQLETAVPTSKNPHGVWV